VLMDIDNEETRRDVRSEVRDLCKSFPLYDFVTA